MSDFPFPPELGHTVGLLVVAIVLLAIILAIEGAIDDRNRRK